MDQLYDQAALDSQYNNRLHVPDYADYLHRWEWRSRETERKLPVEKNIPYGTLLRERLDVYPSVKRQAKTLVFIHGGYWQMLDKSLFQFIADGFHAYGITLVLINYPLAPEHFMDQAVQSCRNAVCWLYHNIHSFNGDPNQLYVAGHSAGGHLAAMQMATDWKHFNQSVPADVLKGACFISGIFDLVPIQHSYLNEQLKLDPETALRNSPVRLPPPKGYPLIVAVGASETAAFNEQSKELFKCWKTGGSSIEMMQLPLLHHFSIVETIVDPEAALHYALCRLLQIH